MISLDYSLYFDRVYGGWYGKCLGGAAGAPFEGIKKIIEVDDFTKVMNPDLPNDDLDIQLLWLEVLEQKGPYIGSCDLADAWMEKCWYPFSEYGYFMKNYARGVKPPYSGRFNNPFFMEGMGCPIRSEIWGFVFPGNPTMAAKYAETDGQLDHADNSVWGEMFFSAVESMAFFEDDIQKLVSEGLKYIPADSRLYKCISMVQRLYVENPKDWLAARNMVLQGFGHPDFTNSLQNIGFTIIALLFGNCDLRKTISIALKCGYDTDCTCATAGAIVGTILGYSGIEEGLKTLIQDRYVIGIDVKRRSNSVKDLAEDTCRVGASIIQNESIGILLSGLPEGMEIYNWDKPVAGMELDVEYCDRPSIGYSDSAGFEIRLKNNTARVVEGYVVIDNIPDGWSIGWEKYNVNLMPDETLTISNKISTSIKTTEIKNTNILAAKLLDTDNKEICSTSFGMAGAGIWKVYGSFFDQLDKAPNPNHPSPHPEGCSLPSVECMVNNEVFLNKQYINEEELDFSVAEPSAVLNAYEDLIPVDENIGMQGQCCFYLVQNVISPIEQDVWAVIGNNDAFRLWVNGKKVLEKDETRYWTPYNSSEIIRLDKGENRIVLKLLRRTDTLKFSFGLRKYEGRHWHTKQWITDLSVKV